MQCFEKTTIEKNKLPGGEDLFNLIKKACGEDLKKYSDRSNKNLRFKQFWRTISESEYAYKENLAKSYDGYKRDRKASFKRREGEIWKN